MARFRGGIQGPNSASYTFAAVVYCALSIASCSLLHRQLLTDVQHHAFQPRSGHAFLHSQSFKASMALAEAREFGEYVIKDVSKTRLGTLILVNMCTSSMVATAVLTKTIFLGDLSVIESTKLADRMLRFVLLKLVLIGALVGPSPFDLAAYAFWTFATGFLKCFVGLARDRGDALLSSPSATWSQHMRCATLLLGVLINDAICIIAGVRMIQTPWAFLWLFDALSIAVEGIHTCVRYSVQGLHRWHVLHKKPSANKRYRDAMGKSSDESDSRSELLYLLDLVTELGLHALSLAHYAAILRLHWGLRMPLIDLALLLDARFVATAAWRRAQGHAAYRKLTQRLRQSCADAPTSALSEPGGVTCAICLETMNAAKMLACGHMYHLSCLREWLQQGRGNEFTCPLCRSNLFGCDDRKCVVQARHITLDSSTGESAPWVSHGVELEDGHLHSTGRQRQPTDNDSGGEKLSSKPMTRSYTRNQALHHR